MSISQDSAATIVCREVFDETSHPTNEELLDYAKRLGIDPDAEPYLLDLAREGLMAALPKGWSPCFHEASGAWYYYQASTGTTTWEHPLDAIYKGLVEQARSGKRQMSFEEDSKATAKDLESHEDATLPKETVIPKDISHPKPGMAGTKIPVKLAPLRKIERTDVSRRKDRPSSFDRLYSRRESDSKSENMTSLSGDRIARDYTNLRFQDPKFYEYPKLLEITSDITAATTTTTTSTPKKEIDLKEVLKRSESLSPWHEKDWEQLSSKFSSEENIIDIDKLSASTLTRPPDRPEKFDKEKHPSQLGQQKELTLSGGGSMFLKSNRSRETTPSQDGAKLEEFQALTVSDDINNADRPKSILREKFEDDDRPLDEERKSVRFDLEKEFDIKFTYSGSEDDWESESENHNLLISAVVNNKTTTGSILSSQKLISQNYDEFEDKDDYSSEKIEDKVNLRINRRPLPLERIGAITKNAKIVGKRFLVRNVSENEHRIQMARDDLETDNSPDYPFNKFEKVKNIDLVSKSETDCSVAKSSDSDELHRTSAIVMKARRVANRFSHRLEFEDDEISDMSKNNQDFILAKKERFVKPKLEYSRSIDDMKIKLNREHEQEIEAFKIELEVKLQKKKKELEESFLQQKTLMQQFWSEKLEEVKKEMVDKEEQEIQALIAEMDEARTENLKRVRSELEVCYEKERQEILSNLKTELDERKRELLELRNKEMGKLENEHERDLGEERLAKMNEYELTKQHTEKIDALKKELEKEYEEVRDSFRTQQREKITKITEDHEKCLVEILRDFRMDEALARKMYKERLDEIRADFARDTEKEARKESERAIQQETIDFEKMRCEKRLLQDKYTALKEKYIKLKNDVRLAVERRSRRKEGYTTASETEKSASTRTRTDRTESSEQNTSRRNALSSPVTNAKSQDSHSVSEQIDEQIDLDNSRSQRSAAGSQKPSLAGTVSKSEAKFESDDTTTASETNANMVIIRKKKSFSKKAVSAANRASNGNNNNMENPVENIRKQLKKLEDLGDQLPSNETAYTVRYPFQDKAPVNASSELEFFRHRIHVERDSVRRAREALRQQRSAFHGRQRAWKQQSARATLGQLVQEERELSDMEVSLHRTRSLLGEKVIHLRHLEQSLERIASDKRNENDVSSVRNDELTLSDISSASSGFSSTDLGTDTFVDKPDYYHESTEIIASLENLNTEIREIWDVLNKRHEANMSHTTPSLMYSYLRWLRFHHLTAQTNSIQGAFGTPNIQSNILSQLTAVQPSTTATQNIVAQYGPNSGFTTSVGTVERSPSNLMERTRNLRDWLRHARIETNDPINSGQATL